ncbi:hypothetical protein JMJ58_21015 (plasmid) [Haloterrigena salifodinae]|uniref:Uncharacterized protein n=1 Tax=Haloterrigena salifodinae TaxID=2675099 RepID=A0A8T8E6U4_9EURY|nr:hypothetical protein [Haloterrigena salifodinae]QRV17439.1 hypothetical protein JMJ58_21015 [Haloterrigena salifodinae]
MKSPEQLGFDRVLPMTVKGYVADWDSSKHHLTLLREGYVPYHWRDTRSFDPDQYEPKEGEDGRSMNNAKGTMNRMSELSQAGGEAAIRAENHENKIFVGTVSPGCLWTGDVSFPNTTMTMKGFRFDRVAEVSASDSDIAARVIDNVESYPHGTLGNAKDDSSLIRDLVRQLEGADRL